MAERKLRLGARFAKSSFEKSGGSAGNDTRRLPRSTLSHPLSSSKPSHPEAHACGPVKPTSKIFPRYLKKAHGTTGSDGPDSVPTFFKVNAMVRRFNEYGPMFRGQLIILVPGSIVSWCTMRGLLPLLLVAAVGIPIWLVSQSRPGPQNSAYPNSSAQPSCSGYSARPTGELTTWSGSANSVYSQSSLPSPAPPFSNSSSFPAQAHTVPGPAMIPAGSINPGGMPVGQAPTFATVSHGSPGGQPGLPTMVVPSQLISGHSVGNQTIVFRGDASGPNLATVPMEFVPTQNLAEIFRFDINQKWVRDRWDRVSSSPGETGLHGLRVPLVTGTNRTDLHGSLTYYFDSSQRPQRITFRGWTGDSKPLVDLLTGKYGFKEKPTNHAGLYVADDGNSPVGALLLQLPTVIRAKNSAEQESIDLELNNPQGRFPLSDQFRSVLWSQ